MSTTRLETGLISVPWGAWRHDLTRTFEVPSSWQVVHLSMRGGMALSAADIRAALARPVDARPLEALVTSGRRVAVAIDDITRPTPVRPVLDALVERLASAGVADDDITIVVACGAHRPPTRWDIEQKVGANLARRLRVVSHDPHGSLVETGVMLAGVPVRLNRAFYEADIRISIGCVMPHPFAAFSGGGKIVIPGLADLEVLARTHKYALMGLAGGHRLDGNRFRRHMEASVRAIGLHWTVNVVVDSRRQVMYLAAGDLISAHRDAARVALECGRTESPPQILDAMLLNAYPKDGELLQIEAALGAIRSGMLNWLRPAAPIVLLAACTEGLGIHGLFGPGGRLFRAPAAREHLGGRPLIIYSPGVEDADVRHVFWNGYAFHQSWSGLLTQIEGMLPSNAVVGVVPCGPLQVAAEEHEALRFASRHSTAASD